ncbi:hypothetical protein [Deinococcus navajonensis]|uniref:Flagellar assembly protein T N-terminal domain-containing protein n=1 Tax=Deinococcus navajonensis TaxID=309884 RepID=A0ABV8XM24_9DEIO
MAQQRLWSAAALTLTLSAAALAQTPADTVTVNVQVSGSTREAAYAQASDKALEVLLAKMLPAGTPLYNQVLREFSRADVRAGRIIQEQAAGGVVSMTVQVSVLRGALEQAVVQAQPQLAQTRIAVVIPEAILRRPVPDPAAETEITRALIGSGMRVVDASQQVTNALRDLVRARPSLGEADLAQLRTRLNTDLLVTGEAFAEEYGAVAGGLRGYSARLEVKVIDLASGQVLHSQAFQGSGVGATDAVAGKTALMNIGRVAGEALPSLLIRALQGTGTAARRSFVVRVTPPATFSQVNALTTRLKTNTAVQGLTVRSMDSAGATLELQFAGSALDLAAVLDAAGATVAGMTGAEITIKF